MTIKEYKKQLEDKIINLPSFYDIYSVDILLNPVNRDLHPSVLYKTFTYIPVVENYILQKLNLHQYPEGKYVKNKKKIYTWLSELSGNGTNIYEWIKVIEKNLQHSYFLAESQKTELVDIYYKIKRQIRRIQQLKEIDLLNLPTKTAIFFNKGIYWQTIIDIFTKYQHLSGSLQMEKLNATIPFVARYNLIIYAFRNLKV